MRNLIWITGSWLWLRPCLRAIDSGTKAGAYDAGPAGNGAPGYQASQLNPAILRTPDNFNQLRPMPTRAA